MAGMLVLGHNPPKSGSRRWSGTQTTSTDDPGERYAHRHHNHTTHPEMRWSLDRYGFVRYWGGS